MSKLDNAIARYRDAQAELLDYLENDDDTQLSDIRSADSRLDEAFEIILSERGLNDSQRMLRIGFLLNFVASRSDREALINRVCDRIYGDAERLSCKEHCKRGDRKLRMH